MRVAFYCILLLNLLLFSCQEDEPVSQEKIAAIKVTGCQDLPELTIPEDLDEQLKTELNWLNDLHGYLEEHPFTPLTEDTLSRLTTAAEKLNSLDAESKLAVHKARANRLIAFDLQNRELLEESYILLQKSLSEFERLNIISPIAQYERAYHYNLISVYGELVDKTEIAIANAEKSIRINAKEGFLTDVMKDFSNLALVYSTINRFDLQDKLLQQAGNIVKEFYHCFKTTNDKSAIAGFYYVKARSNLLHARRHLQNGDTLALIADVLAAEKNLVATKAALQKAGLENNAALQMRVKATEAVLGTQFYFASSLADSALVAVDFLRTLAPPTHPQGIMFGTSELLWRAFKGKDCSGLNGPDYKNSVSFLKAYGNNDMPQGLRTTHLSISRRIAKYECKCGLLTNNTSLLETAKRRINSAIEDFETIVASADLEANIESIGGNWFGYYSEAINITKFANLASLNYDGSSPFSEEILLLPDHSKRDWAFPFSKTIFSLSDRSKSINLRLSLEKRRSAQQYGPEYEALYEELRQLRSNLRLAQIEAGDIIKKQEALIGFFDRLGSSTLTHKKQFYNDLRYFDELEVEDIQDNLLTENRAAIDIFFGISEVVISVITKHDRKQFIVPTDQRFATALNEIKDRNARGNKSASYAYIIYDYALSPAIDWITQFEDINELIMVRDKELADFAFGYLPVKEVSGSAWSSSKLLIDNYAITYAYSLSTLLAAKKIKGLRTGTKRSHATFLTTQEIEVNGVKVGALKKFEKVFKDNNRRFLTGSELYEKASPQKFIDEVTGYKFVAIAGHGDKSEYIDEQYYIQLSPTAESPTGRVTTTDLYALDLPTELTLLINCESARGLNFNYEGRKSLARSFIYAGSSAVIAGNGLLSQESYPEIVDYFYKFWVEDRMPSHLALREAKLKFRRENVDLAPYLWGNLIYYGLPGIYFEES